MLTPRGAELEPVVLALGRWGVRSPTLPRDAHLGVDSVILSLEAQLTHTEPPASYELRLGEYTFARPAARRARRRRARRRRAPGGRHRDHPRHLDAVVSGDRTLADLVAAGEATVDGDGTRRPASPRTSPHRLAAPGTRTARPAGTRVAV